MAQGILPVNHRQGVDDLKEERMWGDYRRIYNRDKTSRESSVAYKNARALTVLLQERLDIANNFYKSVRGDYGKKKRS